MSEVRPRRVHRRARFPCFIDARKWNHSAVSSPREVLAKTVPSTVPVRCVDHAFSVKLTARIPPHHCLTTNRTCSRMPWTAPPRCVPRSDPKRSALANLPTLALPNCVFLTTSRGCDRGTRDPPAIAFAESCACLPVTRFHTRWPRGTCSGQTSSPRLRSARGYGRHPSSLRFWHDEGNQPTDLVGHLTPPRLSDHPPLTLPPRPRLSRSTTSKKTSPRTSRRSSTRNTTPPGTASLVVILGRT